MPDGDPHYPADYLTDQPERFFASEIVREKVLRHTRAELPFSTAVVIDRFEEADGAGGIVRIYASILVDRASQKAIVIGRQGSLVARIGTEAREELERFFSRRVFLDLHVRVRPNWREDTRWLAEMGLRPGSH
jgi:GTP-binding protein Era